MIAGPREGGVTDKMRRQSNILSRDWRQSEVFSGAREQRCSTNRGGWESKYTSWEG